MREESFSKNPFIYEWNPTVETPEYHLSQVFQGILESSNFKIKHFLLTVSGGGPTLPPQYSPQKLRLNPKMNLKEMMKDKIGKRSISFPNPWLE
jgi:hypothetical protein